MTHVLATAYPGGALAVLSAILWLLLTVLIPFALVILCFGYYFSVIDFSVSVKMLRLTKLASVSAIFFIAVETISVGWDAFFLLEDKKYFFEQFPANIFRVSVNLLTLFLSYLMDQKINEMHVRANQ